MIYVSLMVFIVSMFVGNVSLTAMNSLMLESGNEVKEKKTPMLKAPHNTPIQPALFPDDLEGFTLPPAVIKPKAVMGRSLFIDKKDQPSLFDLVGNSRALEEALRPESPLCRLVNQANFFSQTPLHAAVRAKSPSAITVLIRAGADPHQQNLDGFSALHLAQSSQSCVDAIVRTYTPKQQQEILAALDEICGFDHLTYLMKIIYDYAYEG